MKRTVTLHTYCSGPTPLKEIEGKIGQLGELISAAIGILGWRDHHWENAAGNDLPEVFFTPFSEEFWKEEERLQHLSEAVFFGPEINVRASRRGDKFCLAALSEKALEDSGWKALAPQEAQKSAEGGYLIQNKKAFSYAMASGSFTGFPGGLPQKLEVIHYSIDGEVFDWRLVPPNGER